METLSDQLADTYFKFWTQKCACKHQLKIRAHASDIWSNTGHQTHFAMTSLGKIITVPALHMELTVLPELLGYLSLHLKSFQTHRYDRAGFSS